MQYVQDLQGRRFNRRQYSRQSGIARSTAKDMTDRMVEKGFLECPYMGQIVITGKGEEYLKAVGEGVGDVRRGGREGGLLSTHYSDYKFPIRDFSAFRPQDIDKLRPVRSEKNPLANFTQYMIYFDDATILVYVHVVVIRVHEVLTKDMESGQLQALDKAITYSRMLSKVGLSLGQMHLEAAHFERIESLLAGFLERVDEHYKLKLQDGYTLWIDRSGGTLNHETDSEQAARRIDEILLDGIHNTERNLSDIDKMSKVVEGLIRLRIVDLNIPQLFHHKQEKPGRPDYVG